MPGQMQGRMARAGLIGLIFAMLVFVPAGCRQSAGAAPNGAGAPIVRVKLLEKQDQIVLTAAQPPVVRASADPSAHRLNIPGGSSVAITLAPQGWQAGGVDLGAGNELHIQPAFDGGLRVNGQGYRGVYRLVVVAPGKFDVINDVDIDSYLKGVIPREMPSRWDMEAYKAQTIAARTYAMYDVAVAGNRYFHVYDDTRSQVYGGIAAETSKSVQSVDQTAGVVLAYGPSGRERIFHAYFSSCCGGIGQSAADALGEADIPPLGERNVGSLCNSSPRFNWPPVVLRKDDLTRRVRAWGAKRNRPEKDMAMIARLEIAQPNRFGRPVRFVITDVRGAQYSLSGEETRWAINTEPQNGPTVLSSFFKPVNETDVIRLVDGHGWGHGVGLCQWCAQSWAERGVRHEDILRASYPGSILVRAY
jgi:stage II sporulation protein D